MAAGRVHLWLYGLTIGLALLALGWLVSLVVMGNEVQTLQRELSGPGQAFALPASTTSPLTAATLAMPQVTASITSVTRSGNTVRVGVLVEAALPVDLFSKAPTLVGKDGQIYSATTDSVTTAQSATFTLASSHSANFALAFSVPPGAALVALVFNNGS